MLEKLKVGPKLTLAFLFMAALVCVTGSLGIYYTSVLADEGDRVGTRLAPAADAVMEVQLGATRAHLLFEEIMGGDTTENVAEVWGFIDEAELHCTVLIEGGRTEKGHYLATEDPVVRAGAEEMRTLVRGFRTAAEERYDLLAAGSAGAGSEADERFDAIFERFMDVAERAEAHVNAQSAAGVVRVQKAGRTAELTMLIAMVVGVVLAVIAGLIVSRHLTVPIVAAARLSERVADGELTESREEIDVSRRQDEVGILLRSFLVMRKNIRDAMKGMQGGATGLAEQAAEVGSTASEYASSAAEQASAVQEASSTIEEIRQSSEAAVAGAREVVGSAEHAVESGHRGIDAIADAVRTMEGIGQRVEDIAASIQQLNDRNQRIREVVETVGALAEQSNLLAVNASIEAAQAGEHGRGFGVVAAEVRNLANLSKRAAQQIRGLLAEIEKATGEAVAASTEGTRRTQEGAKTIHSVRTVVEELAGALERSSDRARQIAGSAAQQAQGIAQVSEALRAVSEAGQIHLVGVNKLEGAAGRLTALSGEMKGLTARYRL